MPATSFGEGWVYWMDYVCPAVFGIVAGVLRCITLHGLRPTRPTRKLGGDDASAVAAAMMHALLGALIDRSNASRIMDIIKRHSRNGMGSECK